MIVPVISTDFFKCQYNMVVLPAERSPKQPLYYEDISFSHFFSPNYKGSASLIDKIVQNNWIVIQSGKVR